MDARSSRPMRRTDTLLAQAGHFVDPQTGAVVPPIAQTALFAHASFDELIEGLAAVLGGVDGYLEVFPDVWLPHELVEARWPQRDFGRPFFRKDVGCRDLRAVHVRCCSRSNGRGGRLRRRCASSDN